MSPNAEAGKGGSAPDRDASPTVEPDRASRPACPACGGPLVERRGKLICARCRTICETCCEGGRG